MSVTASLRRFLERTTFLFMGLLLLGTGWLFGAGQARPDAAIAAAIGRAKQVRIVTPSGRTVIPRPIIGSDGVKPQSAGSVIPWTQVRSIQVRKRGTLTGLWVGAGLFGGLGGAGAAAMEGAKDEPHLTVGKVTVGALIGGALGAVLGIAVGSMITRWKTVYEMPETTSPVVRLSLAPCRQGGASMSLSLAS
jgi:hypothetical protein